MELFRRLVVGSSESHKSEGSGTASMAEGDPHAKRASQPEGRAVAQLVSVAERRRLATDGDESGEDRGTGLNVSEVSFSMLSAAEEGQDLDLLFELLESGVVPSGVGPGTAERAADAAANAELFRQMAANHARPVRECMLALSMGTTNRDWLEVAIPVIESLGRAAGSLDQAGLAAALEAFGKVLRRFADGPGDKLSGAGRDALLAAYEALQAELPMAFDFKAEREVREPLLVHYQLRQVPGVYKVTIDKLYAAGLGSLEALCRATPEDLVALGRLDPQRAHAIVARFEDYRRARAEQPLDPARAQAEAAQRLRALLGRLASDQEAFLRAEASDDRELKRTARRDRQTTVLDLIVALVHLGEVDLVGEIERSATERKVERVRGFVAQHAAGAAQVSGMDPVPRST